MVATHQKSIIAGRRALGYQNKVRSRKVSPAFKRWVYNSSIRPGSKDELSAKKEFPSIRAAKVYRQSHQGNPHLKVPYYGPEF